MEPKTQHNKPPVSIAARLAERADYVRRQGARMDYRKLEKERQELTKIRIAIASDATVSEKAKQSLSKQLDHAEGIILDIQYKLDMKVIEGSGQLILKLVKALDAASKLLMTAALMFTPFDSGAIIC